MRGHPFGSKWRSWNESGLLCRPTVRGYLFETSPARVGLGPTRVHQLVTSPQADSVEHAQSVLREVGWPAPEDSRPAAEEQVADRLIEEAAALVYCIEWLESLSTQIGRAHV